MGFHQTHHPQFASSRFFNQSQRGMFGDALSEMDHSVGVIIDYLKSKQLEQETFVFFSSDNGPSLLRRSRGGNAGPLKCGKGTTFEGGVRVPAIGWMPGHIPSGRVSRGMGSMMDLVPTIAEMVGLSLPNDRQYDGVSMMKWLFDENGESEREINYFWPKDPDPSEGWQQSLHAVRSEQWRMHWIVGGSHCNNDYADTDCRANTEEKVLEQPLLFNLYHDVAEAYPVDITQPYYQQIVDRINVSWATLLDSEGIWGKSQLQRGRNDSYAPCCSCDVTNDDWPHCCGCDKLNETLHFFTL